MLTSHTLLLQLIHDGRYRFSEATICYLDRGAPKDCTCINGDQIASLEPYYLKVNSPTGTKAIPYHRIRKITYQGAILWQKSRTDSQKS